MLLPVLDDAKHYWVSTEEVDKLIRRAATGWPGTRRRAHHPPLPQPTRRSSPAPRWPGWPKSDDTGAARNSTTRSRKNQRTSRSLVQRREAHPGRAAGARRAGASATSAAASGALTRDLLREASIDHVVATDVSARALQLAARHLNLERMPDKQRERLTIFQSSLTYRDDRLAGLDAAVLMEVIEHLDPDRIPALERVVFGARGAR